MSYARSSSLAPRSQAWGAKGDEYEQTQILATLQEIAAMMDAEGLEAAPVLTSESLEGDD